MPILRTRSFEMVDRLSVLVSEIAGSDATMVVGEHRNVERIPMQIFAEVKTGKSSRQDDQVTNQRN